MSVESKVHRVTTKTFRLMKERGERIAMLTAYDFTMAGLLEEARIDGVLVGDSAANVMAGYGSTLPITLDEMIYHAKSVVRAIRGPLVVVDMPFGSYQGDPKQALKSAIRIIKESGADAVKLEGGKEIEESVVRILSAGIPVMGHLGLTPQSIHKFGTYAVRATEQAEADRLRSDAMLLDRLGCFAIVLEKIPTTLGAEVSKLVSVPVIGIGAGGGVDGQILVVHDMLGMTREFNPRFLRRYAQLGDEMLGAFRRYIADVRSGDFPNEEEQY